MFPIRVKTVQESDLRMLGSLARNIQRVLPVTQADIDAAAALGKGWVVWKVFEVSDPLDNLRGGTQLVIRQNSILPGQSVQRVLIVSGPGGQTVVIRGTDYIVLPDAIANSLSYVKAFGGTIQNGVPQEYTRLEYIESTGTQYIDLGIKGNGNTKVEVKFKYHTATSATGSGRVFGSRTTSSSNAFAIGTSSGVVSATANKVFWCYDAQSFFIIDDPAFPVGDWQTVVFSATEHTLNGVSYGDDYNVVEFETPQNLKLFGFDSNETMGYGQVDIAYCKVWDNGVLIRDLVPAKNSSNVIGMYDRVSGQFLTNQGTGDFVAGSTATPSPDIPMDIVSNNGVLKARHQSGLPLGYKLVDYIKANARIELDTLTNNTMEFVARFYREGLNPQYLYQSDTTSGGTTNTTAYMSSGGNWRFGSRTAAIDVGTGVMITSVQNADGVWINGEQVGTYEGVTAFTSTNNLRLFGTMQATPQLRLYGLKVYQNGAPFYDLVPCQRESDSAYGVYDLVRGQFFTNADATITAGSFVSDPVVAYTDGTVETINVHGKNLFDISTIDAGYSLNTSGEVVANDNYAVSAPIPIKLGTYTFSQKRNYSGTSDAMSVWGFAADGTVVRRLANATGSACVLQTFEVQQDIVYIRIAYRQRTSTEVQVELGSTATEYAPYYNGGTATAEMLLKVGDYQDEQEILSGAVTRNVGVKVLDGSENWAQATTTQGVYRYRFEPTDAPKLDGSRGHCMSTHFFDIGGITTQDVGGVFASTTYLFFIPNQDVSTVANWKNWLADQYAAGTPVIVVYPVRTPTTESVTGQALQVQAGDNTLEITQASLTGLELEAQYQAAVSLTIQEVEDANLDNNVEVTIS